MGGVASILGIEIFRKFLGSWTHEGVEMDNDTSRAEVVGGVETDEAEEEALEDAAEAALPKNGEKDSSSVRVREGLKPPSAAVLPSLLPLKVPPIETP